MAEPQQPPTGTQTMNRTQAIVTAVAIACVGGLPQASAQEQSATLSAAHGMMDGHAYQTGSSAQVAANDLERKPMPFDLQLALSEGRQHADAHGIKLTITDSAGQTVFALDKAGALTDVDLPAGHYHVVSDFGRVRRMGGVDVEKGELATLYLHAQSAPGGSGS
jgi:hypothetical protein